MTRVLPKQRTQTYKKRIILWEGILLSIETRLVDSVLVIDSDCR